MPNSCTHGLKKTYNIFNEFKSNDVKLTKLDLICVKAFKYIVRSFKSTYKNHLVIKRSMHLIRHMRAFHTWLSHLQTLLVTPGEEMFTCHLEAGLGRLFTRGYETGVLAVLTLHCGAKLVMCEAMLC